MPDHIPARSRFRLDRRGGFAILGAGLLALGGATGAIVTAETRPSVSMAPAVPVAIRSLSSGGIVTIRGRVAEVYGNKFIVQNASGRALVDTGRDGESRALATVGTPVTVQGRFDHGFVHAAFLVAPDGKVMALGPLAGPPHGPHDGPDRDHGPDRDRDRGRHDGPHDGPDRSADRGPGAPPPPPGADGKAPPPPPPVAGANGVTVAPPPAVAQAG